MDPSSLAVLSFGLQVVNTLVLPALYLIGRFLWKLDRRVYAIEVKLQMHQRSGD